eukprot:TRINITY_DN6508_c0_g1_i1.p1 TRINITY_DN6508_c0_g1~~TRINITY_DN6508_c0_g1_i1.p1  ORF type:complete len:302 (+),score=89.22 TRINITY_DN6508_c0_g1_i1:62-967(+)
MAKYDSSSDLYELRNFFFLGNYQGAINEGSSLSGLNDQDKIERDVFLYRSYVAQKKYTFVMDDIKNNAPTPIQAVKLLATYFAKSDTKDKELPLITLKEWMSDSTVNTNQTLRLIAAIINFHEGNYEEAMRAVYQTNNLESIAMLAQIYLKINRLDLAEKELKAMQKIDDDATITQLVSAWVNLAAGGDRIKEATLTYNDLMEKYVATPLLLIGLSVCNMHHKRYAEAEKNLLQALEKDSSNPDILSNLIACYEQQGKSPELITRQISQLKIAAPKHPWLNQLQRVDDEFDRVSRSFAPSH